MHSEEGLHIKLATFDVFTEVLLTIQAVWDVTPCRLVNNYRLFKGSYGPNLQCYIFQE